MFIKNLEKHLVPLTDKEAASLYGGGLGMVSIQRVILMVGLKNKMV